MLITYQEKLKEAQNTFSDNVSKLLIAHFNYIIEKYGNWYKYPRKVKKFLKKKLWWNLKDSAIIKENDIKVIIR